MTLTSERIKSAKFDILKSAKRQFKVNSLGIRLFLVITGGVLVGMGGMSLLFGETVKFQAEDQIKSTLKNKVSTIEDVIDQAETLAYGLNVSVTTLHVRRAETPETYQELVRQLFQGRPDFVTGLGFGQAEYGVLPSQRWLFPYYYSAAAETASPQAEPSADTESEIVYVDQTSPEHFYPETPRYLDYFVPQINRWTTPYQSDRGVLLTYYSQMFDPQGYWLGTVLIDVDGTHLSAVLDEPVLRNGGQLMLLSATGDVIANPADPNNLVTQTHQDIPGLREIWPKMDAEASGFLEGETGYWAYVQFPDRDWRLIAYVPYRVVFGRVMLITLGATTVVGLLLAVMVALVIRYLNRRIQPALTECHRLSETDPFLVDMVTQLESKDEIDQLSTSFFYLLDKYRQQSVRADLTDQQRQLLEQALTADGELLSSQLMLQAQQWAEKTDNLSHILTKQAYTVDEIGQGSRQALAVSQEKMRSVTTEIEVLRQDISQLLAQLQTSLQAADLSTQITEKHENIVKVAKALMSNSLSILARPANTQDLNEVEDKVTRLQRFSSRLQELTEQFSEAAVEQKTKLQQVEGTRANLDSYISTFSQRLQALTRNLEASNRALEKSQVKVSKIAHLGEPVTHASQQLEKLTHTIQHTIQEGAIAEV